MQRHQGWPQHSDLDNAPFACLSSVSQTCQEAESALVCNNGTLLRACLSAAALFSLSPKFILLCPCVSSHPRQSHRKLEGSLSFSDLKPKAQKTPEPPASFLLPPRATVPGPLGVQGDTSLLGRRQCQPPEAVDKGASSLI